MAFVNAAPFNLTLFTSSSIQKRSVCEPVFTTRTASHASVTMGLSRRDLLRNLTQVASTAVLAMLPAPFPNHGNRINAAMYSAETAPSFSSTGDPSQLSTHMPQIEAGYKTLLSLRDNWEQKTAAYDGDVVRRDLGTVGLKSPLFNIRKTLFKAWQVIANSSPDDELVERLESEWNDVVNGISSVDFQLYSVSFTELRESKDSLITQGRAALDDLIKVYSDMLVDFNSVL